MANETMNSDQTQGESPLIEGAVIKSPFCGSLRYKKFFMLDALATSADQYLDASNHCWCRETQQVIGPDNGRVQPDRCVPGRSCYSSAVQGS